ncbi:MULTISPECIES: hypothetical protein [Caballeronia]|uniref:Secreted protein n=1 Tax=Caballeronia jiangsuensis TaxID=1458357 RepID=A0ABW9CWI0_9BURK|nr:MULTISPECIES: hypothetical protein [unclassified Caballeronia]
MVFATRAGFSACAVDFFAVLVAVAVFARASAGAAAKDVATAMETAMDNAERTATPCTTFNDENISVFISVLLGGWRVPPSVVKQRNLSNIKHLSALVKLSCKPGLHIADQQRASIGKKRSSRRNRAAKSALFYTTANALSAKLSTTLVKRVNRIGQNAELRIDGGAVGCRGQTRDRSDSRNVNVSSTIWCTATS